MPRRQPHTARRARAAATLLALAGACVAGSAQSGESPLMQMFAQAAAPALQAAAPSNDPMLVSREVLNRTLESASTQMQRLGPLWLERVRIELSFDPLLQPRYALAATQPLLASRYHDSFVDLHGRIVYDTAGQTAGSVGLQYRGRWYDQDLRLAVQGGIEDRRLEEFQRFSLDAELHLRPLEVRARLYDDVPARPATRAIANRRLDGYDLAIGVQVPYVPWASLRAERSWQTGTNGEAVTACDRVSLRLTPFAPLEIEAGAQTEAEVRSWFARLRWSMALGD